MASVSVSLVSRAKQVRPKLRAVTYRSASDTNCYQARFNKPCHTLCQQSDEIVDGVRLQISNCRNDIAPVILV